MAEQNNDLWIISDEQKLRFAGLYLLEYMINRPHVFQLWLERDDSDLEPVLEWLLVKGWISIHEEKEYIPNEAGREVIEKFLNRYAKFVYFFDVFSAVDLAAGEFAFERYFELLDDAAWQDHLADPRFEDLRIAVAEHLDIDAVEIVFMSFVREDRFGRNASGWQFDLLLGKVWDEILEICNEAIDINDLTYSDGHGTVSGEVVIEDILNRGATLLARLLDQADHFKDGLPPTPPADHGGSQVVAPVTFPSAAEFDFSSYIAPTGRDPFWEENWS